MQKMKLPTTSRWRIFKAYWKPCHQSIRSKVYSPKYSVYLRSLRTLSASLKIRCNFELNSLTQIFSPLIHVHTHHCVCKGLSSSVGSDHLRLRVQKNRNHTEIILKRKKAMKENELDSKPKNSFLAKMCQGKFQYFFSKISIFFV